MSSVKRGSAVSRVVSFFLTERGTELRSVALVRLAVGLIFLTQGILKFTDPRMGVIRFTRIGFPVPGFTAHFVGTFEITCGALVLVGLFTRVAAIPLLIVIGTAIGSTKVPELCRAGQGFWFMVSDARTDFAMLCSLIFLVCAGAGSWSLDAVRRRAPTPREPPPGH
jgi:putative oxidoreductase